MQSLFECNIHSKDIIIQSVIVTFHIKFLHKLKTQKHFLNMKLTLSPCCLMFSFNSDRTPVNRLSLVEAKRKYKRHERFVKRRYFRSEGDRISMLRRRNPKLFYQYFKRKSNCPQNDLKLDDFFEHFKVVCNDDAAATAADGNSSDEDNVPVYDELDVPITYDEINNVLKSAKLGKSPGIDNTLNEFFVKFKEPFVPILLKLFNAILETGEFPSSWSKGIIFPLFKKGDANNTNNYRGITLVSCLSKLFTSVLNNRLLAWSKRYNIVSDAQFGFKPGVGTNDAIFALHGIIKQTLSKKRKLYCCFVDYRKAFDSVNRNKLFLKLSRSGVTGKLLNILKSLYKSLKSCVRYKSELSDFFSCSQGLMQGEGLSPFLYSMYVNDFENELINTSCEALFLRDISLFLLLYADDTVLFSESASGLQNMLDSLKRYSDNWQLTVNTDKTKIIVFRNGGRLRTNNTFYFENNEIETVDSFNYLGVTLNFNGRFTKTQFIIADQGRKCMFNILKICKNLSLNVESKLNVFDVYVSTVLNFGCEVWGFNVADKVEKVHIEFLKRILNAKKCTPSFMVYSELGRLPLQIERKCRIIKYWLKLIKSDNCILKSVYEDMVECNHRNCNWRCQVKHLLLTSGFGDVWFNHYVDNEKLFLQCFKQRLTDNFIQTRNNFFANSSKCYLYKYLIDSFTLQYYLTKSIPDVYLRLISKFRLSSHTLCIEEGRYRNIPRAQRLCTYCIQHSVEDEFHFVLICPQYVDLRKKYIKNYYWNRPSSFKLVQLLSVRNRKELCNLGKYLQSCLSVRSRYQP